MAPKRYGKRQPENLPRCYVEIERNRYFDRAAILKSRIVNRRSSITDLTISTAHTARQNNQKSAKKTNPFNLKGRRKSVHFCSSEQSAIAPAVEMASHDVGTDAFHAGYDENRFALEFFVPDELVQPNMDRAPAGDLTPVVMEDDGIVKTGAGDTEDRPILELIGFDGPIQPNMARAPAGYLAPVVLDDDGIVKSGAGDSEDRPVLELIGFDGPALANVVEDITDCNGILLPIPTTSTNISRKRPVPELMPIKRPVPKLLPIKTKKIRVYPGASGKNMLSAPPRRSCVAQFIIESICGEYIMENVSQPATACTNKIEWDENIGSLHYDSD